MLLSLMEINFINLNVFQQPENISYAHDGRNFINSYNVT